MIYLFSGNSRYLVKEKTTGWKNLFIEKHGDFDLVHIKDISTVDKNFLSSNLTGASFFGGRKLIILENTPGGATKKENKVSKIQSKQSSTMKEMEEWILSLLENIPENNIVLFSTTNPDKRGKLYKKLKEISKHEEFNLTDAQDVVRLIQSKYGDKITSSAIDLIISYKSSNIEKIVSELDKLLIGNDQINDSIITNFIVPELEESIFQFIDDILNQRKKGVMKKLSIILESESIYRFYNNLLANLRINYYIFSLINSGMTTSEIRKILQLGNRAFILNKNYKISPKSFIKLYLNLQNIDKKMKSGGLIGTSEIEFRYELEKILLKGL